MREERRRMTEREKKKHFSPFRYPVEFDWLLKSFCTTKKEKNKNYEIVKNDETDKWAGIVVAVCCVFEHASHAMNIIARHQNMHAEGRYHVFYVLAHSSHFWCPINKSQPFIRRTQTHKIYWKVQVARLSRPQDSQHTHTLPLSTNVHHTMNTEYNFIQIHILQINTRNIIFKLQ